MIQRASSEVSLSSITVEKKKVSAYKPVEKDYKAVKVYDSQNRESWWNVRG
jgi:hypothetical protein